MKKRLAILLLSALALTCAFTVLSVSAETYTDKINLLPESTDVIVQNDANGTAEFSLSDGKLTLTRAAESQVYWPSIRYEVLKEVNLTTTPYLHLSFTCSSEGEYDGRGVNGHVFYTVDGGEEQDGWFSEIAGRDVDDFRGSADLYFDFAKVAKTTGKITVTKVVLSIYGEAGETVVWNALAFASDSNSPEESEESEESSEASEPEESSAEETTSDDTTTDAVAEESTESTSSEASTSSVADATSSEESSDGAGTLTIVLIAALGVAVVAAVVIIIVKRKK